MSAVETSAYEWETIDWKEVQTKVYKLQKRIYQASQRGDVKVMRRLQRLLMNSWYAKLLATRRVSQDNRGKNTPGVDRVAKLRNPQKVKLARRLRTGDKAQPTRRVWIPKPGKDELRPLGIPTMEDRARQALAKLALEPEWEAKFEPNSYGFRPGRSCHDAIAAIYNGIVQKPKYVLDADIAKCFDRIDHGALLEKLGTFPKLRRQVKAWLKAGVMDGEALFPTEEGTPQGGVISPLLANIALHGLEVLIEENFRRRVGKTSQKRCPSVIRYADDFVVMDESLEVVLQAKTLVEEWLKGMGLELKPSKTRIAHTLHEHEGNTGFDFLGFTVKQYSREGRGREFKTLIRPSKEAVNRHLEKLDDLLQRNQKSDQEELINVLNPVIRGWTAYYSTVASKETFDRVHSMLFQKLFAWAKRRVRSRSRTNVVSLYWGANRGKGWQFMTPDDKFRLIKHQERRIKRHVKVKENCSPYDGNLAYWAMRLAKHPMTMNRVGKLLREQEGKCSQCGLKFTSTDILEVHHVNRALYGNTMLALLHAHCHDITHNARYSKEPSH